eukprot:682319-Amphidinium_carterae.3
MGRAGESSRHESRGPFASCTANEPDASVWNVVGPNRRVCRAPDWTGSHAHSLCIATRSQSSLVMKVGIEVFAVHPTRVQFHGLGVHH